MFPQNLAEQFRSQLSKGGNMDIIINKIYAIEDRNFDLDLLKVVGIEGEALSLIAEGLLLDEIRIDQVVGAERLVALYDSKSCTAVIQKNARITLLQGRSSTMGRPPFLLAELRLLPGEKILEASGGKIYTTLRSLVYYRNKLYPVPNGVRYPRKGPASK